MVQVQTLAQEFPHATGTAINQSINQSKGDPRQVQTAVQTAQPLGARGPATSVAGKNAVCETES